MARPRNFTELRRLLVDTLGLIDDRLWQEARRANGGGVAEIIAWLQQQPRCHLHRPLPCLTNYVLDAIDQSREAELLLTLPSGDWLLLDRLNRGGQGDVYLGMPRPTTRQEADLVAIKIPLNAPAIPALQRELDLLRQLCHPNVVRLIDGDPTRGIIVTRFVDGPSVQAHVNSHLRLTLAQTVRLGIDLCNGLEVLHAIGHIHRDVKPANVILEGEDLDRAVLIDFGLAQNPTQEHVRFGGTPFYIAPEIYFGRPDVDHRADIYGLGATLFCMLIGWPPRHLQCLCPGQFIRERSQQDEIRFQMIDSPFDCDLLSIRPEVPHELSRLIVHCLRYEPTDRPTEVATIRHELEAIQRQLRTARLIETSLRQLTQLLLEAYRVSLRDVTLTDVGHNATLLRQHVQRARSQFPVLERLRTAPLTLAGINSSSRLHYEVVRCLEILESIERGLDTIINQYGHANTREAVTWMLTALDGLRDAGHQTLATAHAWLTWLHLMGCVPR